MSKQEIESILESSRSAWGVPGVAAAVVIGDEVVYLGAVGVKEQGKTEPMTPDTVCAIASTTKAFTCTALAMQTEEGLLGWEDPVSKHIPFFRLADPLANTNVTLRDLVTHRTGLSRHDLLWFYSDLTREEILKRIGNAKPNTSFRSTYEYNNVMYLAAGYACGMAERSSWEEVLQRRILSPLGMTNTSFSIDEALQSPNHSSAHETNRAGECRVVDWTRLDNCAPGGGLNSSVRDMSKWLRFQVNGGEFEGKRLISLEKLQETHSPQIVVPLDAIARETMPYTHLNCYGLGWGVYDFRGERIVAHGGWLEGFRTQVALVPEKKIGFIVIGNHTPSRISEALRSRLLDYLLGFPAEDWDSLYLNQQNRLLAEERTKREKLWAERHQRTQPSRELSAYTGAYENPVYGTLHITQENGNITVQWSYIQSALTHFHFDTFHLERDFPFVDELLTFALDSRGEVVTLTLMGNQFVKRTA
jgi:CubicO group peptidase (beta-lactamase class C family)